MCQLVEEYAAEKVRDEAIKIAINLLKNGASVDLVARSMPSLSLDFIKALQKQFV